MVNEDHLAVQSLYHEPDTRQQVVGVHAAEMVVQVNTSGA